MRQRSKTHRVIFHHSLSRDVAAATITKWHKARGFECIGYHFVVRYNGDVEHGRDQAMMGAHAMGRNVDSIGVCITGDFSKTPPSEAQLVAAAKLYAELCETYGERLAIEYHRPAEHASACPGRQMERAKFEALCRAQLRGRV